MTDTPNHNLNLMKDLNIIKLREIACPICNKKTLQMLYKTIDVPYIGSILITTIICRNCKFKVTDIWMIFEKGSHKPYQQIKVTKETINYLICASAGSKIKIPEIDAEMDIKTFDAQHITTIEGLLREIYSAVQMMLPTAQDKQKAEKISQLLKDEIDNPTGKLTVILNDPSGHSSFIPYEYWTKRTERERQFSQEFLEEVGEKIIMKWKEIM